VQVVHGYFEFELCAIYGGVCVIARAPGGGGVLLYMGHVGMCGPKG